MYRYKDTIEFVMQKLLQNVTTTTRSRTTVTTTFKLIDRKANGDNDNLT